MTFVIVLTLINAGHVFLVSANDELRECFGMCKDGGVRLVKISIKDGKYGCYRVPFAYTTRAGENSAPELYFLANS